MKTRQKNPAESGMKLRGVAPWGVKWPFSLFIPRRHVVATRNRCNILTCLIAWYLLEEARVKTEDRTYGNSSIYLITDVKKHDFVCSFFLCVMLANSSTPTSIRYFKYVAEAMINTGNTEIKKSSLSTMTSGGSRIVPRWGANIRFCQIFPKTAWNWKNLDPWGRAHPSRPLRSATDDICWISMGSKMPSRASIGLLEQFTVTQPKRHNKVINNFLAGIIDKLVLFAFCPVYKSTRLGSFTSGKKVAKRRKSVNISCACRISQT